jgi:hypothetical protein
MREGQKQEGRGRWRDRLTSILRLRKSGKYLEILYIKSALPKLQNANHNAQRITKQRQREDPTFKKEKSSTRLRN